jgi:TatA/E family protein of Tat protein translocase
MPFGLQPIHLVVIFIVALLIFGPRRLPEMGRGIGRAINEFRKGTQEMTESFRDEIVKPSQDSPIPVQAGPLQSMAPPQAQAQPVQPQPAAGNFCTQCSNANPAEARFCNKCGSPLPA